MTLDSTKETSLGAAEPTSDPSMKDPSKVADAEKTLDALIVSLKAKLIRTRNDVAVKPSNSQKSERHILSEKYSLPRDRLRHHRHDHHHRHHRHRSRDASRDRLRGNETPRGVPRVTSRDRERDTWRSDVTTTKKSRTKDNNDEILKLNLSKLTDNKTKPDHVKRSFEKKTVDFSSCRDRTKLEPQIKLIRTETVETTTKPKQVHRKSDKIPLFLSRSELFFDVDQTVDGTTNKSNSFRSIIKRTPQLTSVNKLQLETFRQQVSPVGVKCNRRKTDVLTFDHVLHDDERRKKKRNFLQTLCKDEEVPEIRQSENQRTSSARDMKDPPNRTTSSSSSSHSNSSSSSSINIDDHESTLNRLRTDRLHLNRFRVSLKSYASSVIRDQSNLRRFITDLTTASPSAIAWLSGGGEEEGVGDGGRVGDGRVGEEGGLTTASPSAIVWLAGGGEGRVGDGGHTAAAAASGREGGALPSVGLTTSNVWKEEGDCGEGCDGNGFCGDVGYVGCHGNDGDIDCHGDQGSVGYHGDQETIGCHGDEKNGFHGKELNGFHGNDGNSLHGDEGNVGCHGDRRNVGCYGNEGDISRHGDEENGLHGDDGDIDEIGRDCDVKEENDYKDGDDGCHGDNMEHVTVCHSNDENNRHHEDTFETEKRNHSDRVNGNLCYGDSKGEDINGDHGTGCYGNLDEKSRHGDNIDGDSDHGNAECSNGNHGDAICKLEEPVRDEFEMRDEARMLGTETEAGLNWNETNLHHQSQSDPSAPSLLPQMLTQDTMKDRSKPDPDSPPVLKRIEELYNEKTRTPDMVIPPPTDRALPVITERSTAESVDLQKNDESSAKVTQVNGEALAKVAVDVLCPGSLPIEEGKSSTNGSMGDHSSLRVSPKSVIQVNGEVSSKVGSDVLYPGSAPLKEGIGSRYQLADHSSLVSSKERRENYTGSLPMVDNQQSFPSLFSRERRMSVVSSPVPMENLEGYSSLVPKERMVDSSGLVLMDQTERRPDSWKIHSNLGDSEPLVCNWSTVSKEQLANDSSLTSREQLANHWSIVSKEQLVNDSSLTSKEQLASHWYTVSKEQLATESSPISKEQPVNPWSQVSKEQLQSESSLTSKEQPVNYWSQISKEQLANESSLNTGWQIENPRSLVAAEQLANDSNLTSKGQLTNHRSLVSKEQHANDWSLTSKEQLANHSNEPLANNTSLISDEQHLNRTSLVSNEDLANVSDQSQINLTPASRSQMVCPEPTSYTSNVPRDRRLMSNEPLGNDSNSEEQIGSRSHMVCQEPNSHTSNVPRQQRQASATTNEGFPLMSSLLRGASDPSDKQQQQAKHDTGNGPSTLVGKQQVDVDAIKARYSKSVASYQQLTSLLSVRRKSKMLVDEKLERLKRDLFRLKVNYFVEKTKVTPEQKEKQRDCATDVYAERPREERRLDTSSHHGNMERLPEERVLDTSSHRGNMERPPEERRLDTSSHRGNMERPPEERGLDTSNRQINSSSRTTNHSPLAPEDLTEEALRNMLYISFDKDPSATAGYRRSGLLSSVESPNAKEDSPVDLSTRRGSEKPEATGLHLDGTWKQVAHPLGLEPLVNKPNSVLSTVSRSRACGSDVCAAAQSNVEGAGLCEGEGQRRSVEGASTVDYGRRSSSLEYGGRYTTYAGDDLVLNLCTDTNQTSLCPKKRVLREKQRDRPEQSWKDTVEPDDAMFVVLPEARRMQGTMNPSFHEQQQPRGLPPPVPRPVQDFQTSTPTAPRRSLPAPVSSTQKTAVGVSSNLRETNLLSTSSTSSQSEKLLDPAEPVRKRRTPLSKVSAASNYQPELSREYRRNDYPCIDTNINNHPNISTSTNTTYQAYSTTANVDSYRFTLPGTVPANRMVHHQQQQQQHRFPEYPAPLKPTHVEAPQSSYKTPTFFPELSSIVPPPPPPMELRRGLHPSSLPHWVTDPHRQPGFVPEVAALSYPPGPYLSPSVVPTYGFPNDPRELSHASYLTSRPSYDGGRSGFMELRPSLQPPPPPEPLFISTLRAAPLSYSMGDAGQQLLNSGGAMMGATGMPGFYHRLPGATFYGNSVFSPEMYFGNNAKSGYDMLQRL